MYKILNFDIERELLYRNKIRLADTIRMALYQSNPTLFSLLNYDNDSIFLEPTLFWHFLSDIDKPATIPLAQCLLGYIPMADRPGSIPVKADRFGLVNLPNLGYIRANLHQTFTLNTAELEQKLIPHQCLPNSTIRLSWHPTDLLSFKEGITFHESVEVTAQKYQEPLFKAVAFFQQELPEFWQILESLTREFVVFNSPPEQHSFAGIMQHGTSYFNVENAPQTLVFFIDDIAHQCGHIIFNTLTLDTGKYLRVPKDFPLQEFTGVAWERRGVYGAFHGLFTYTTILHSLDRILDSASSFDEVLRYEALGRLGFYINKFGLDLTNLNNSKILTDEGMDYHRQFADGYSYILKKYQSALAVFDYRNQPYTFQYNLFNTLNPLLKPNFA